METNAAQELLAIVGRWDEANSQYLSGKRTGKGSASITRKLWEQQNRAVALMMEIESFSAEIGDDVDTDPFISAMWEYIYAPTRNWVSSDSGIKLDPMVRRNLGTLAKFMAGHRSAPRLDDAEIDALRGAIQQSIELLAAAPDGHSDHRAHITYLLSRCKDILDGADVDLIALRKLSFEAVGAAMSDATLWAWDESGSFFQNVSVIARTWGPKMAGQAATQVSTDLVIDGGKVVAQLAAGVVKGYIEGPQV